MIYRVVFTQQASRELDEASDWWAENRDRNQAGRWYAGFSDRIAALSEHPERSSFADENDDFPSEIRQLNFGLSSRPTHRAVYTIVDDSAIVLTVRHTAQGRITPEDILEPIDDQ